MQDDIKKALAEVIDFYAQNQKGEGAEEIIALAQKAEELL